MKEIIADVKQVTNGIDKFFTTIAEVIVGIIGFAIAVFVAIGIPLIVVGACAKYLFS